MIFRQKDSFLKDIFSYNWLGTSKLRVCVNFNQKIMPRWMQLLLRAPFNQI